MPVQFQCPNCRSKYDIADDMVGKTMLCRECEQRVSVPASGAAARPAQSLAKSVAASSGGPTRRNALVIGLAGFLPGALMGWFGGYYWKRPLLWEIAQPRPRRERPEGAPEGEQTAEGQPADGQARGRTRSRGPGGGGGNGGPRRGGRNGGGQNPPGENPQGQNPPPANPPMETPSKE